MQPLPRSPSAGAKAGPESVFRHDRSVLLDCVRAGAILAVLIFHVATRYDAADLDAVARVFRRFGLLGVDVFFPLSGFLITRYLLKASKPGAIKVFFQRRFFRIVPLYMLAVTFYLVAGTVMGDDEGNLGRIWIPYLFLTGWFVYFWGETMIPYTITWSLSVEEFAYILFGLFALASRRSLPLFLFGVSLFALLLRFYLDMQSPEDVNNFPPARLDSIAMGGLTAWLLMRRQEGVALALALSCAAIFLLALNVPLLWETLKYVFITLGTCAIMAFFETSLKGVGQANPVLRFIASIGFYSYFTYLFHLFNIHLLLMLWAHLVPGSTAPFWGMVAASLAVTQVQAMLSFRWFEGPLLAFGRRLERKEPYHAPRPATETQTS